MSSQTDLKEPVQGDFVVQDGVRCPSRAPWAPAVGTLTTLTFLPIILPAFYTLAQTSVLKLLLWLLLFGIFAYPLRSLVCKLHFNISP